MAQLLSIHATHPQARLLKQAAQALHQGKLVVYPSETTYGVACHMGDKSALDRLIALRLLEEQHQFTLACKDLSELGLYARVDNTEFRLLKRNTPGAFTFILPATREVPKRLIHPKKKTIGLRVPDHPVAQGLLEALGEPMLITTLRMPGDDACLRDGDEIAERLGKQVDVIIDSGTCGQETSTVVDLTGDEPQVIRAGLGELI